MAEAGGESSQSKSLIGSGTGAGADDAGGANADAPCKVARMEGGTKLGGRDAGISFPASLP